MMSEAMVQRIARSCNMTCAKGLRISSIERSRRVVQLRKDVKDIVIMVVLLGVIAFLTWYVVLIGAGVL